MDVPCKDCKNCGCGSYHDKCPEYQKYLAGRKVLYENRVRNSLIQEDINAHIKSMKVGANTNGVGRSHIR